jgi:hypothetical protein
MEFLGGVKLSNNIQVHLYKNHYQHWLSLYKDDKFIDFVANGAEISGLNVSPNGMWLAYFQKSDKDDMTYFTVWNYVNVSATDHELVRYCELLVPVTAMTCQSSFNSAGTHVACLAEWNRIHVVDLRRLDAPTEFYCATSDITSIHEAGTCFIWLGQDDYVRVIDLTMNHLIMWRYKLNHKKTKYLFIHNNRVIYMNNDGIVGVYTVNLQEKRLGICYDVKYPTGKYTDITIEENWKIVLHKKNGEKYVLNL